MHIRLGEHTIIRRHTAFKIYQCARTHILDFWPRERPDPRLSAPFALTYLEHEKCFHFSAIHALKREKHVTIPYEKQEEGKTEKTMYTN
jgi:hypothetical protein